MKKQISQKGFTLIELLIAMSIFMIFMVSATDAFLQVLRAQKTANETRLMYSELRNFVDYLNNELREGGIDYFCYNLSFLQNLDFNQMALVRCDEAAALTIDSGNNLRTISKDGLSSGIIKFDAEKQKVCVKRYRNVNGSWQLENGYEGATGYNLGAESPNGSVSPAFSIKPSTDAEECGTYQEFAFANLKVKDLKLEIFPKVDPQKPDSTTNLANQLQPIVRLNLEVGSKLDTVKFDLKYRTLITTRN